MTQFVYGKNVVAQLLDDGRKIHEVWLMQGFRDQKLVRRVQEARIPVKWVNRAQLDAKVKTNRHQGVAACIDAYRTYSVDEILEAIPEGKNGLIIMLDELEDPHNLGAILRTAETAGVHGVVIPKRRSAGLTSAVYKASAGAVEYVPVARVSNITDALREMKKRGVWVYGLDMDGETWCSVDMKGAAAVVVGSEGRGISRLVKEQCDFIVSLPMRGHITSLNASVACGIVLYEAARQRQGLAAK